VRECKEKLKSVHSSRASQLDLASGSRLASHQKRHTCEACRRVEESY